jgi:hypothetical protein
MSDPQGLNFQFLDVPAGVPNVLGFVKDLIEAALGEAIDSGLGLGGGDLWFTWEGREYFLHVEPSGNQLVREAKVS